MLAASFGPQRAFVEDEARFTTAVCSRRAGKSIGCATKLLRAAKRKPGSVSLYLTKSRINAKRIIWRPLLELNRQYGLGGEPNESELCLKLPNGATVYLAGVNDRTEVDKYRGLPLGEVVIDESQSLPAYIEELVDQVIAPALMDYNGSLDLIGTPAPVPTGYFHKCAHSKEWAHHAWTVFDNPHILAKSGKTPREHLDAELKRRGINEDDPIIQREWYGRWVLDRHSLVFAYDAERNGYDTLPDIRREWQHVIGIDLGFDDADAIAVLAWHDDSPDLWLVEEWAGAKQGISELGDRLSKLHKTYDPMMTVVDTGGLGKKIADEIQRRTQIPMEAAEKERKLEHIELLNDALRTGRFHAKRSGLFAHDSLLVEWDRTTPEKPKISDRFHSDICDAVLYAYRKSLHWTHEPAAEPPSEEDEMRNAVMEQMREQQRRAGLEPITEGLDDSSNWDTWNDT